jgi:hypothetical protein
MKSELRRNKVATTNQLGYVLKQKYNKNSPYDKFSALYGVNDRSVQEYIVTPIPDYVDVTYDFIGWCEYQNQLNYIVEQFVYFTGQSFGERNSLKFSTNVDSFTMEDNNTTGQDRVVRCSFQITVHGYLLPKSVGTEITTKRTIGPNKVTFGSEAYSNLIQSVSANDRLFKNGQFRSLNYNEDEQNADLQRRLNDFTEKSLKNSPDVYPTEND